MAAANLSMCRRQTYRRRTCPSRRMAPLSGKTFRGRSTMSPSTRRTRWARSRRRATRRLPPLFRTRSCHRRMGPRRRRPSLLPPTFPRRRFPRLVGRETPTGMARSTRTVPRRPIPAGWLMTTRARAYSATGSRTGRRSPTGYLRLVTVPLAMLSAAGFCAG